MRQHRFDAFAPAVNDVHHALGQSGFEQKLHDANGRQRNFLARLEHERVAAGQRDRIHPQRNHRRKVERRDPGANSERLANGVAINPTRNVLHAFAHEQRGNAAGELDHLDAAFNVAARFGQRLAVFARVEPDQFLEVLLQQRLELETRRARARLAAFPTNRERRRRRLARLHPRDGRRTKALRR